MVIHDHKREHLSGKPLTRKRDLIDELMNHDIYKDKEQDLIDECFTFFIAGMFTIRASSSNMLIYLAR